jgi:succinate-semialdehyde dehydrogenase/glutarate-semialdehyde dehydrogenase
MEMDIRSKNEEPKFTSIIDPATGALIGKSELTEPADLKSIITKARTAQKLWSGFKVKQRAAIILKVRDLLALQADEIAEIISKDNGKTKIDALAAEVMPAAMAISYYCKNAKSFLRDKKIIAGNIFLVNKRSRIINVPYGVVGIISPWNYPFTIPFSEIVMGLLAGNAIILKTASETQLVGLKLKEIFESVGLPENLFNYVNLPGKTAGDGLLDNGIDKLFFTGSVPVGKYLMERASKNLTPLVLELGGNDPMIVCEDADPYRAAMGALWGGFQNAGQSCAGIERIYVHEKIYDEFMGILREKITNLKPGYGSDYNSQMGCITTEKQFAVINSHIKDALEKGASVFAQSAMPDNKELKNFIPASVFVDVNHEMLLMKEETFGPVVGVMKFKDYEEAIALANDSHLGLTASVWSRNTELAEKIGRRLEAGAVTFNDHLMSHGLAETPWGGFKLSGIGRTHGRIGFDEMSRKQVLVKESFSFMKRNLWWHPYSEKLYNGLNGLICLLYSKNLRNKLLGLRYLIKILPRAISRKDN